MWFARVMALGVLVFAFWYLVPVGCEPPQPPYSQHHYQDQFPDQYHYSVAPDFTTAEGIRVDTSGVDVDLAGIDRQTDAVEACLGQAFGRPPLLPADLVAIAHCDGTTFPLPLLREDLVVKIASNWVLSCDGSEQLLPPPAPCDPNKPPPPPGCVCHWRAGIQDNRTIVVTPNLYLYKDPLIRLTTGCNNPWVGQLAACAAP